MEYTLHKDFSEIPAEAWNGLAQAGISDTPFARYEMLSTWWQTRGGGEWPQAELVLISASENGRLTGIAPLFQAEYEGRNALLLVGSIEVSDYLDLIVRAEDLERFVSGLLDFLAATRCCANLPLDWYNVPHESPTRGVLKAEAEKRAWAYREEVYRPTPRISLEGGFDAYLARLDKKQRHEIRRKMRRAGENPAPVTFHIVEDGGELEAQIEAFLELMSHDPNKAEFLKPAMREHVAGVIRTAFEHGYLWLAFLAVGEAKAAAALNFDYKNKLWGYNSGVNREFMELSPGWVLLTHQIQWACEHGRSEFDFMRGDEDYKYRFGGVDRHVMRLIATPQHA
jgi:CelD/BcsL family acetyltransferase involved in cellulose biosynthesis